MVATGSGLTVMVTEPLWFCEHEGVPEPWTLIRVTGIAPGWPVGTLTVAVLPTEMTVCGAPVPIL
jgi:hypothetical protein